jgi:outer membrane protein assembly factor BamB
VSPDTGRFLWRYQHGRSSGRQGSSPVFLNDIGVFISDDMWSGAAAFRVSYTNGSFSTATLWTNGIMMADTYATAVFHKGYLYVSSQEHLRCVEPATGKVKWDAAVLGAKSVILVNDQLLTVSRGGDMRLATASPLRYRELARTSLQATGEFLNSPAVCNGRIYVRDPKQLICYDASVTSRLNLGATLLPESGRISLIVSRGDGAPLTNYAGLQISLWWSSDLAVPLAQWNRLTNSFVLTNGCLRVEQAIPQNQPAGYYIAAEATN